MKSFVPVTAVLTLFFAETLQLNQAAGEIRLCNDGVWSNLPCPASTAARIIRPLSRPDTSGTASEREVSEKGALTISRLEDSARCVVTGRGAFLQFSEITFRTPRKSSASRAVVGKIKNVSDKDQIGPVAVVVEGGGSSLRHPIPSPIRSGETTSFVIPLHRSKNSARQKLFSSTALDLSIVYAPAARCDRARLVATSGKDDDRSTARSIDDTQRLLRTLHQLERELDVLTQRTRPELPTHDTAFMGGLGRISSSIARLCHQSEETEQKSIFDQCRKLREKYRKLLGR